MTGARVRVSVLIANHNYAEFLPDAIESVLGQTHRDVELVVVDDGSTDRSRAVIASYGDRVRAFFKEQEGQASALNLAFAESSGDIVCLLDADDFFAPTKVEAVVSALTAAPGAALAFHQLQSCDRNRHPLDAPWPRVVPTGDLRPVLGRTGGWYPRPTTSALSFLRTYLEQLFPIPTEPRWPAEAPRRRAFAVELKADTYLAAPAAFLGPVAGVARPLASYRIHGANKHAAGPAAGDRAALVRRWLAQQQVELEALEDVLERLEVRRPALSIEDHPEYQWLRRALGATSTARAVRTTLRCPALPVTERLRESARLLAGRGLGRRVGQRSTAGAGASAPDQRSA